MKQRQTKMWFRVALSALLALFMGAQSAMAQTQTVTGRVTDPAGESIIGAMVTQQGTQNVVITDVDGNYAIRAGSSDNLVFSYMGHVTQTVAVDGRQTVNIVMQQDAQVVDDVIVVGFGVQKKASVVGAISTISPKDLKVPSSNISNAFAGRLSGVIAVQRSGEPGADGSSFWIRGISTFQGSTSPLIFIDGVEASTYDMNSLAPETIDNFNILKDATATALYGARGANGVMLITTRQGSNMDRARINIRVETGWTQPTKTIDLADGVTYMTGFNEALATRDPSRGARNPFFTDFKIEQTRLGADPYLFPNIDWQKFLFKSWASNQTGNLNVTGGGEKVTYFMSASFNNDTGMLRSDPNNTFDNNIKQQRYSIQGNITANLTKTTKVAVRLNSNILQYAGSRISSGTIYSALFNTSGVLFPAYYPAQEGDEWVRFGNVGNGPHATGGSDSQTAYYNVYAQMVSGYSQRSENTNTTSFELDQKLDFITEGLSFNAMYSFKNWTRTTITREFYPTYYQREGSYQDYVQNEDGTWDYSLRNINNGTSALQYSSSTGGDRTMNFKGQINWARAFGKHNTSAMVVYQMRDYNTNTPGDYIAALPQRSQEMAARIAYDYDTRYLLELNAGYTGSENFADGKRFGFFPSIGLGYNISREEFWKPLSKIVSNLKIYGSYGLVGNSSIGSTRFPYLTKVNLSGRGYSFGYPPTNLGNGASIDVYGAEDASWESGIKANIGIDMNLFNSLNVTFDLYRENRSGIFMRYASMPNETGIPESGIPFANLGKVKNEGFDLAVNYDKAFNNGLILNVRGTVTYSKNTLLAKDEPMGIPAHRSEIGRPLNQPYGLIALGLFVDDADVANSPEQRFQSQAQAGDIKYLDLDENGIVNEDDMTYYGSPTIPQLVYGFGASAQWKGFDFSLFFQGTGKTSLTLGDIHPFGTQFTQMYKFIADDHWTEDNQNLQAKYPRLVSGADTKHNNFLSSTYWVRDASFIRLKNVEVGYTYKFARIYLAGQNLVTFSPFKHWDPEVGGGRGLSYPPLRMFMAGVQLTF